MERRRFLTGFAALAGSAAAGCTSLARSGRFDAATPLDRIALTERDLPRYLQVYETDDTFHRGIHELERRFETSYPDPGAPTDVHSAVTVCSTPAVADGEVAAIGASYGELRDRTLDGNPIRVWVGGNRIRLAASVSNLFVHLQLQYESVSDPGDPFAYLRPVLDRVPE